MCKAQEKGDKKKITEQSIIHLQKIIIVKLKKTKKTIKESLIKCQMLYIELKNVR